MPYCQPGPSRAHSFQPEDHPLASRKTTAVKSNAATVNERIELMHGPYRIIAGALENECRAIAYLGPRQLDTASAATVDEAVTDVKALLDQRMAQRRESRVNGTPSASEYREALASLPATQRSKVLPLLLAHGRMPEGKLAVQELVRRFDFDATEVLTAYRRLGRSLSAYLDFAPKEHDFHAKQAVLAVFAIAEQPAQEAGPALTMALRPELIEGLLGSAQASAAAQGDDQAGSGTDSDRS